MAFEGDVAIAPNGEKTADKILFQTPVSGGKGDAIIWLPMRGNTAYTFSVWLWSPLAKTINLAIKSRESDSLVAIKNITLTPEPTRYSVSGITSKAAYYDVDIGRTPYPDAAISMGEQAGDYFYVWGAQVEEGSLATTYDSSGISSPNSIREWRIELFILNILMFLLVAVEIIGSRKFWFSHPSSIAALAVMFSSLAQSLAIIPEQRFAIGFMIFFWIIAVCSVMKRINAFFNDGKFFHSKASRSEVLLQSIRESVL
jgi:hypothetical protein